ncbi:MAG: hypothetical protein MJY93_07125 [Fibrobacter sp.]|nr:hypothetical protein [Fibrobacter sp.]
MIMRANMNWTANQGITLPVALVEVVKSSDFIQVFFTVEEPQECFRSEIKRDGDHSWEDSCVEVFLKNPANTEEYFNFEVTCRGHIYAAHGINRDERTELSLAQLKTINCTKQVASVAGNLICWGMTIQIPASIFGIKSFDGIQLLGNFYKCADKAKTPHYLSAFPIDTEKPDFHRPEFFQEIWESLPQQ